MDFVNESNISRFKKVGRELLWVGAGYGLATIGGVVGVRIITGELSPADYGILALAMTGVSLIKDIILNPLSHAYTRYFAPAKEKGQLQPYLKSAVDLSKRVTLILSSAMAVIGLGLFILGFRKWLGLTLGAFILSLLSGYNNMLNGIQNAARQRLIVAWHQGFRAWIRFLLALALIALLGATSTAAMWGYGLAALLVLLSQLLFLRKDILPGSITVDDKNIIVNWKNDMLQYAWPFMTWGIFTWAQLSSEQWALQAFASTQDVGLYTVLYQLGYYPIAILSNVMVQLISPILFIRAGDATDRDRMARTHRLNMMLVAGVIVLSLIGAGLTFIFHEWIFSIFAAPGYQDVSSLLPWMVVAGGLFASAQVITLSFFSELKSRKLITPKILTATIGVGLNVLGVYWLSLPGAVFAKVGFSLLYFLWVLFYLKKHLKAVPDVIQPPGGF